MQPDPLLAGGVWGQDYTNTASDKDPASARRACTIMSLTPRRSAIIAFHTWASMCMPATCQTRARVGMSSYHFML